jgi:UDPglucose 6-dehydrogenase
VTALIRTAREAKAPLSLVEQVDKVNTERKIAMAGRIEAVVGGSLRGKTVAVLGVTFKPNTDDMREAPSLTIIPMLQARGARIRACDPQGRPKAEGLLPGVEWSESALEAAEGADVLVALTEWNEFRALDLKQARDMMRGNVLVDLRNMYAEALATKIGFVYYGVGRTLTPQVTRTHTSRRSFEPESGEIREVTLLAQT